jgi:hypothetical protein
VKLGQIVILDEMEARACSGGESCGCQYLGNLELGLQQRFSPATAFAVSSSDLAGNLR